MWADLTAFVVIVRVDGRWIVLSTLVVLSATVAFPKAARTAQILAVPSFVVYQEHACMGALILVTLTLPAQRHPVWSLSQSVAAAGANLKRLLVFAAAHVAWLPLAMMG